MKYKVIYFETTGIAEVIRLILSYAKEPFVDERVIFEDWPERKKHAPFGHLPLFEIDGKQYHQSIAVSRYLANLYGLAGNNLIENMELDAIVDTVNDLRIEFTNCLWEKNVPERLKKKEIILKETVPYFFERFEKMLRENGGYFYKSRLTWADLFFVALIPYMNLAVSDDILKENNFLLEYVEKISKLPGLKEWMEKRPKTCCLATLFAEKKDS